MIDKLIEFAKQHDSRFSSTPKPILRRWFETYKKTTLIYQRNGNIRGFAIYQEWPDCLNFICIAGIGSKSENLKAMLAGRHQLPKKKLVYFDEEKMELKILCQPQQQQWPLI